MINILEVSVISIDKSDDSWDIEGEVVFDGDITTAFSATYFVQDEELEELELEISPENCDRAALVQMIINAALNYDE